MADESKSTSVKASEPKVTPKAPPKPIYIRAVHGRMVDPHTALEYSQTPSELLKRTGWVDSQLQAKKMELVDM